MNNSFVSKRGNANLGVGIKVLPGDIALLKKSLGIGRERLLF